MRPEGLSMKNSNEIIGNRTRDLPACIAVPQPPAPPRALDIFYSCENIYGTYTGAHLQIFTAWNIVLRREKGELASSCMSVNLRVSARLPLD